MSSYLRTSAMCGHAYIIFCRHVDLDPVRDCHSIVFEHCCKSCRHKLLSALQNCLRLGAKHEKEKNMSKTYSKPSITYPCLTIRRQGLETQIRNWVKFSRKAHKKYCLHCRHLLLQETYCCKGVTYQEESK